MTEHTPTRSIGERPDDFTGDFIIALTPAATDAARAARLSGEPARLTMNDFLTAQGLEMRPLIDSVSAEQIDEIERAPLVGPLPDLPSLHSFYRISQAPGHGQGLAPEQLLPRLRELPEVDIVYPEMPAHDPSSGAATAAVAGNPLSAGQKHLDAAPAGIDARWMWALPSGIGTGSGVGLADVEAGWNLDHEDLASKTPELIVGDNRHTGAPAAGEHGTKVLAVVTADDNAVGVVGVAPDAGPILLASRYDRLTNTHSNVASAIACAIYRLRRGDVLLVEVQRGPRLPTEVELADLTVIARATANGIVVVEAAGNGREDLDAVTVREKMIFNRADEYFCDSGAIMVAAGTAEHPYSRSKSNYGSRIDCFAHGEMVTTAGGGDLAGTTANNHYTAQFRGTSAAAAIIAGAAILVQGRHKAVHGTPLTPREMRDILSDPATGTKSASASDRIGVMPDLAKIPV